MKLLGVLAATALLATTNVQVAQAQSVEQCVCMADYGKYLQPPQGGVGFAGYQYSFVSRPFMEDRLDCLAREPEKFEAYIRETEGVRPKSVQCIVPRWDGDDLTKTVEYLVTRSFVEPYGTIYPAELVDYRRGD